MNRKFGRFIERSIWTGALFFGITAMASAASTISTNIQTDGTLSVTGLSTLGNASTTMFSSNNGAYFGATATSSFNAAGALTLASALTVGNGGTGLATAADGALVFGGTGGGTANLATLATSTGGSVLQVSYATGRPVWVATSTLGLSAGGGASLTAANTWTGLQQFNAQASTTMFSSNNGAYFGATATSSFNAAGALTLATPLTVLNGGTGVTTFTGTGNLVFSISPIFTGTSIFTNQTLSGLASTSQLKVGTDQVSTISGMIFGPCALAPVTITASTTAYTTCTTSGTASGVTNSYTVFLQNSGNLTTGMVVEAASSTPAAGIISLRITNVNAGTVSTGSGTLNVWAVR